MPTNSEKSDSENHTKHILTVSTADVGHFPNGFRTKHFLQHGTSKH